MKDNSRTTTVQVLDATQSEVSLDLVSVNGRAWPVIWPETGAHLRSLHRIDLGPAGETHVQRHPMEAVYYVLRGEGEVNDGGSQRFALVEGSMVHVQPQTSYRFSTGETLSLIGGPCPIDAKLYQEPHASPVGTSQGAIRIFHRDDPGVQVPLISRDARLIIWLGAGAETANMNFVRIAPGEGNVPHIHAESEDTIYILEGRGTIVDFDHDLHLAFEAGQVIHVPVGIKHAVYADKGESVVSVGGPAPADKGMLRAAGLLPAS